ncbi:MAG TPA: glycosyltransferase [Longimicrobium sp.]
MLAESLAAAPGSPGAADAATDDGRPLTIVHLAAPARFGGLERVVEMLAGGQAARGHRVHLAAILDPGAADGHPLLAALTETGVSVHVVDPPARAYRRERAAVRALLARLRPDVVHTHGYRADVLHGAAARGLGIPTLSTVHGFTGGDWKNRVYEWLQRRALRRFDAVVAVSRRMGMELERRGVRADRLRVIANAWTPGAPPLARDEARRELGLGGGVFALGWVGRVSREKGLDVLVDALPHLADLPIRLVVLGDGPERGAVAARAERLCVAGRIDWRGPVAGAGRWMAAFDAWVLSSRTEGTPVTLFEAAFAGAPIVAAAVGGVPDVVSPSSAMLVPPERPDALAAAIQAVYGDPAGAADRARRARERIETAYAPGPWLDAHDTLYRRALSRARSR